MSVEVMNKARILEVTKIISKSLETEVQGFGDSVSGKELHIRVS